MYSPISVLICMVNLLLSIPREADSGYACLSNPCLHGVCLDDLNSTYSCYCIDGYTGVMCQTNWDECWSSPCQNGGICIDGIASFNCSCPAGFVGDACEQDFDECESNPCLNNGTCIDGPNGYTCSCAPGYSGLHCDMDIAVCNATGETRCMNGGMCVEGPGLTFKCRCQPGWTGLLCDVEIDECMSNPCENGAVCIDLHADYACACLFGFAGRNCEEVVLVCEDNLCENNALCLMEDDHPVCYCVPDYHGDRCQYQYDECQLGPRCLNGGTCIDGIDNFTCSCPPKLTGVFCECLIVDDVEHLLDCFYISPTSIFPYTTMSSSTSESTTTELVETTMPSTSIEVTTVTEEISTTETETESASEITTASIEYATTIITTITTTDITPTYEETSTTTETMPSTTTEMTTITMEIEDTTFTTIGAEDLTPISTTLETITAVMETTEPSLETTETIPVTSTTVVEITEVSMPKTTTEMYSTMEPSTSFLPNFTTEVITSTSFTTLGTTIEDLPTLEGRETNDTLPTVTVFMTESPFDFTSTTEMSTGVTEFNITVSQFYPDCSKEGNFCRNGGSCVWTQQGHRCICLFDTDGDLCEHHLGIKNAAFGGDSFLSHKLHDRSNIAVEFKAKTTSSRGLIFYTNIDQTYMALYIENGYLKFKFSCGYQTMLLSELGKPVNNGYDMRINAELTFTRDYSHCNASIKVNNTLSMSGDQLALNDKFSKKHSWLYLGGVPNEYIKDKIQPGFVGCMSELKMSNKKINIFKDAEDGYGITECSSLACLSNPCQNNGVCLASREDWVCHCKNGYSGKMCEYSVCTNNPCRFGGTCLPHTGSGYICLCPYGKHGHFCETDLQISKPYFSSSLHGYSSHVAYAIPKGQFNRMEIKFRISPATMEQIALLMFLGQKGQHDFHSDHMAVSFVKGYIMLTWNLGSGPRRIFTTKPLQIGKSSYLIHIGRQVRRSWLYVEDLGNVTGRSPGNLVQLDVVPLIYFGGHDSQNFSTLPHDLPLHTGFSGCIFDMEFKSGGISLPLGKVGGEAIGRAVGQCGTTECHEKICQNDGACLYHGGTFICLCQDGFFGPLCSTRHNSCDMDKNSCASGSFCIPRIAGYDCDCTTGKSGTYCEKDEALSDISFTGIRSFLSIPPKDFELLKFNIEFEMRPLKNRGVVLFVGRTDSFLCLSILSGILELRIFPARKRLHPNELLVIRSNKLMALGDWNVVKIGLYGRKVYLFVDNIVNTGILQPGEIVNLSDEDIFIGGLPNLSTLPPDATASLPIPYEGCFRKLTINNAHIPLTNETIKASNNIADCDGTPCGGDFCENSGSCWLDPNLKPHCSCLEPYYGDKCEKVRNCGDKPCLNRGRCLNGFCNCVVGYQGAFCENAIIVHTPKFYGNSFLMGGRNYKKRDAPFLEEIYLNFSTAHPHGLIVWMQKEEQQLGVGLENGRLKLAVVFNDSISSVDVLESDNLSDGLQHGLRITFNPLKLMIDGFYSANQEVTAFLPNVFYLGGIPVDSTTHETAQKIFNTNFIGCMGSYDTDKKSLGSYAEFSGENIGNCV